MGCWLERRRRVREQKRGSKREGQRVEGSWAEEKQQRGGCMSRLEEDIGGAVEGDGAMCKGRVGERGKGEGWKKGGLLFALCPGLKPF